MPLDQSKIKCKLYTGLVYQVHHFTYLIATTKIAHIEVFEFAPNSFGSQATIRSEYTKVGAVSSGRAFGTIEEAINDVVALLEDQIIDDPFVREIQQQRSEGLFDELERR